MRMVRLLMVSMIVWMALNASALAQQANQPYPKWEYKIVDSCNEEDRKVSVHQLGEDGWELAGVDAANCQLLYFKRPLRKGAKPTPTPPASKPDAPKCSLPIEKAPVIRGLKLGMSLEELMVRFPGMADSPNVKDKLKDIDKPPKYGAAEFHFYQNSGENNKQPDDVSIYRFTIFDNRVRGIVVNYRASDQTPDWPGDSLIAKLSEAFELPGAESWEHSYPRKITCDGFEIAVSTSGGRSQSDGLIDIQHPSVSLTLTDTTFRKIIQQRIEEDKQKQRRAFKF